MMPPRPPPPPPRDKKLAPPAIKGTIAVFIYSLVANKKSFKKNGWDTEVDNAYHGSAHWAKEHEIFDKKNFLKATKKNPYNLTSIVFFPIFGDFTWRVSDCEELVGSNHRRLNGIDQVESVTVTLSRFKQYKFFFEI